jgi:hypothetical protein
MLLQEDAFIQAGYGAARYDVMHNDFVIPPCRGSCGISDGGAWCLKEDRRNRRNVPLARRRQRHTYQGKEWEKAESPQKATGMFRRPGHKMCSL